ncbi:CBS domain-containing protein [Clostridium sp. B9]|uniref:CBS domain-containing protein n=1 Tax=Clostridium sp. B9 TaxID=3423224 RepID=UPI003D2F3CA1
MLVKSVMTKKEKLDLVNSKTLLKDALKIMEDNKFLSIPVVDGDKFRGAVSKSCIYEYYFKNNISKEDLLNEITVEEILKTEIPIINKEEHIETAVAMLEKMRISFVAVVDEFNNFKGILTHKAVFREFTNAFGLNKGERIVVRSYDVPGQLSKITKIISQEEGDFLSVVIVDTKSLTDVKEVIVRVKDGNISEIKKKLKEAGFKLS